MTPSLPIAVIATGIVVDSANVAVSLPGNALINTVNAEGIHVSAGSVPLESGAILVTLRTAMAMDAIHEEQNSFTFVVIKQ